MKIKWLLYFFSLSLALSACTTMKAPGSKHATSQTTTNNTTTSMQGDTTLTDSRDMGKESNNAETNNEQGGAAKQIQSFNVSGKIAVQTSKQSGSASVDWSQHHQQFAITLLGPLGSHRMQLSGHPGAVTLVTGDGKRISASSPEELLAKSWGFRVPVSHMYYWIRGLAAPGLPARQQYDHAHRLVALQQGEWHIQYLGYMNRGNLSLPTRLYLVSPAMRVKIMIYHWGV